MLDIKVTENYGGIEVKGDYADFEQLYDSILEIIGDEEDYPTLEKLRIQILAFCYDLRHAKQGNREIELVENNMNDEIMKWHSIITPINNVYYKFKYILTQAIFVVYALNIFIDNYKYKKYKSSYYTKVRLVHQYLELIDCRYLAKNKEDRLKGLVNTTKRVIRYWEYQEYIDLEQELIEYAEENQCDIDNIIIDGTEYPKEIDW